MKLIERLWKWLCKTKTSTIALLFSVIYSIAFTIAIFIFSAYKISLPEPFIICVYSECGVIGLTSGAIAIRKIKVGEVEVDMSGKDEGNSDEY